MKLIREEIEKVEVITEGTGKSTRLYIKGPFLQAEDGIRDLVRSRGLGDVYKRQFTNRATKS